MAVIQQSMMYRYNQHFLFCRISIENILKLYQLVLPEMENGIIIQEKLKISVIIHGLKTRKIYIQLWFPKAAWHKDLESFMGISVGSLYGNSYRDESGKYH